MSDRVKVGTSKVTFRVRAFDYPQIELASVEVDVPMYTKTDNKLDNMQQGHVKADMLMDYRDLPFPDGTFRMVVLDPPHLRNAGETSYMAQKYGCLDQETWKADLKTMFSECFRVLKEHGVLIFKWNETQIPVSQILKLTAHKPLFGNKQPNRTGTHWIVFMKEDAK